MQQSAITTANLIAPFNWTGFKADLINWIISSHISFHEIEQPEFRRMLKCCNPIAEELLLLSHNMIISWVIKKFQNQKIALCKQLAQHLGLVHFSFDLWTSPNSLVILGIVGHWADYSETNVSRLLGLQRLSRLHSGENLYATVLTIINDYNLHDHVGYFMLDNMMNNDTCMDSLC